MHNAADNVKRPGMRTSGAKQTAARPEGLAALVAAFIARWKHEAISALGALLSNIILNVLYGINSAALSPRWKA